MVTIPCMATIQKSIHPTGKVSASHPTPSIFTRLWQGFKQLCALLIICSGITLLLISGIGQLGHRLWLFDLASHFALQYFGLTVVLILIAALFRLKWALVSLLPALIINSLILAPYLPTARFSPLKTLGTGGVVSAASASPVRAESTTVRMMTANLYYHNTNTEMAYEAITAADPDILVLVEMGESNKERMAFLDRLFAEKYHFSYSETVVYSNIELQAVEVDRITVESRPQTFFTFDLDGKTVTAIAAHAYTPTRPSYYDARNIELNHLAKTTAQLDGPVILTGDLNISSFSPIYRQFAAAGELTDGRQGFGVYPSWNIFRPMLQIPIDHFLATDEIKIKRFETGQPTGSDHLPIIVDFSVNR